MSVNGKYGFIDKMGFMSLFLNMILLKNYQKILWQ